VTVPLLAVDGGNTKTDVALLAGDGTVLAVVRGPTVSHQQIGLEESGSRLLALVGDAARAAGLAPATPIASLGVLCLAGMDLPSDARHLVGVHGRSGIASAVLIENDTVAALRAGSPEPWGVAVVVGAGINGVGIAPDGRRAGFAGLGPISGDRGGGGSLGMEALGAAVRARDGRGRRTALERLVPAHFGLRRPIDVTIALYGGRIPEVRIHELAVVAVQAAADRDAVAIGLLDALADECAAFAIAAIRRLRLLRRAVPVVLSGGVARGAGPALADAVAARIQVVAPRASVSVLHAPPVLGAALLGLDRLAPGSTRAAGRARAGLTMEAFAAADGRTPA
jgi:N-acetylglucosamine kinase-like BadF-type ATPase